MPIQYPHGSDGKSTLTTTPPVAHGGGHHKAWLFRSHRAEDYMETDCEESVMGVMARAATGETTPMQTVDLWGEREGKGRMGRQSR